MDPVTSIYWPTIRQIVAGLLELGASPHDALAGVADLGLIWSREGDSRAADIAAALATVPSQVEALAHGRDLGPGTRRRMRRYAGVETFEDARIREEDARRERVRRYREAPAVVDWADRHVAIRRRLRNHREAREALADALGAKLSTHQARRIRCPDCSRRSVWYWLEPGSMSSARCGHSASCGWRGELLFLAEIVGADRNHRIAGDP